MPLSPRGKPTQNFNTSLKRLSALLMLACSCTVLPASPSHGNSAIIAGLGQSGSSLVARAGHLSILRARVAALQEQRDQYDSDLLHAMNGLGEALISAGQLREANEVLEQQIQILRIHEGLYAKGQIALVHRQLAVMAAQQNWLGMQDRLSYLSWLLERAETLSDSEKLNNMKVMRNWTRLLLSRGPRHKAV